FKKLAEEKAAWRSREHEKVRAILEDMKADLDHEKKNRRRLEMINLKLVNELKEAKMSAKQLLQEYDNERKARELTEEVCNELAREVEEDKAEIEALKHDSLKLREEVDEERKMLQMAEVWREERVQMKLVDAKLTLDAKYTQLSKLQQDVEAFIAACSCARGDIMVVEEAENIIQ
ncbi:Os04g0625000, partial [Oryza sativa Japonica Group]